MVAHAPKAPKSHVRACYKEDPMIEEREIASWRYKKGVLDKKTAFLCYLAANLAVGNTT